MGPRTADLAIALGDCFGPGRCVIDIERRPYAYRSSFPLEELEVGLEDGSQLGLLFKDLSWCGVAEAVRRAKPEFLHDPRREIEVYRRILGPARLGTATCHGTVIDPPTDRYWLFLERVSGVELYQVGDAATWQQAARWLARLHFRLAPNAALVARSVPLLIYDEAFYHRWLERARDFAVTRAPEGGRWLDRLAGHYERVVERLTSLPVTVIHGEFYASNILVQPTAAGPRICPVDWEMAALGPDLIDLAALTAGKWSDAQREEMALAYADEASALSGMKARETLFEALDFCRLHLAVQWLGWSPDWSPPVEHAHDWLADAQRLAEKLRL
jgi:hypothetical protein